MAETKPLESRERFEKWARDAKPDAAISAWNAWQAAERETLERAAQLIIQFAKEGCDEFGTVHFCDQFGCKSLERLAKFVRDLGKG